MPLGARDKGNSPATQLPPTRGAKPGTRARSAAKIHKRCAKGCVCGYLMGFEFDDGTTWE